MAGSLSRRQALAARGRPVGYGVAWPPGSGPGDRLPVCLLLHAADGDQRAPFERLRLHHHLAQAAGRGRASPFALASADGRGSGGRPAPGDDPLAMLLDELLPLLAVLGLGQLLGRDSSLVVAAALGS